MKRLIIIAVLSGCLAKAPAQNANNPFRAGESLEYMIYYGLINGGIASFKLEETHFNGKKVLHGKVVAETTGLSDKLFGVRDVFESYFDYQTGLPYKAIRNIKEGKFTAYNEVLFYHDKNYVMTSMSGKHEVPDKILDMVTTFYYLRTIDYSKVKNGDIIKIVTFFDDEVFPFDMRYRGIETIKTKMGKFECHKFVPFVEPGRVFKTEDDMEFWMSADENMIPVRVRFDLMFGSIKCDLIDYKLE